MADSPRLFFALWPDADTARRLAGCTPPGLDAHRRIPAEHLHLTLLFLGTLPAPLQPRIRQAAGRVRAQRFTLCLDQVGQFARAEVVWVGASVTPPGLQALARELRRGLDGVTPLERERELVPHVTLARRQRILGKTMACVPVTWEINEFVLVESRPQDRANRFRTLDCWPLRP
jgi:2'-5' RNA ligase